MTAAERHRSDYAALGDRLRFLLGLRILIAGITVTFAAATSAELAVPFQTFVGLAIGYLGLALVLVWMGRKVPSASFATRSRTALASRATEWRPATVASSCVRRVKGGWSRWSTEPPIRRGAVFPERMRR